MQLFLATCIVAVALGAEPLKFPKLTKEQLAQCISEAGLEALAKELKLAPPLKGADGKPKPGTGAGAAAAYWIFLYPTLPMADAAINTGVKLDAFNKLFSMPVVLDSKSQFTFGVVTPNADTLYIVGWLDLSNGPVVIETPDNKGRYFMLQLLDGLTNVIGTPGSPDGDKTGAHKYVILPPGVKKESLPADLTAGVTRYYSSNTLAVWVIGRVFVRDAADGDAARALQAGIKLRQVPLKAGAKPLTSVAASPVAQAALASQPIVKAAGWGLSTVTNATAAFVAATGLASGIAKLQPQEYATSPLRLGPGLGLDPPKGFSQAPISAARQAVLADGWKLGQACITGFVDSGELGIRLKYGWSFSNKAGKYGDDYLLRAAVSLFGLGANAPEAAIYLTTNTDDKGKPISGAGGAVYKITFNKPPPVSGFASLTLYNATNKMFPVVPGGPALASINYPGNSASLKKSPDGTLPLWLSTAPPPAPALKSNWLAIGADGPSYAILRLYGPSKEAVAGEWQPPAIVKIK